MMEESDTYLAILEEGETKGLRKAILRAGEARFGTPEPSIKSQFEAVSDMERLGRMMDSVVTGGGWREVIETG